MIIGETTNHSCGCPQRVVSISIVSKQYKYQLRGNFWEQEGMIAILHATNKGSA